MSASRVLILDDEPAFRAMVRDALGGLFDLVEAGTEHEFRALWARRRFDLLLLDMRLRRGKEGLDVLREVFAQDELQPVIMMSAYGDTESAIEAVGAGAMMFLHKREFSPALLARMVEAVIEQGRLRRQVRALRQMAWAADPETLLGNSPAVRAAVSNLREAASDFDRLPVIFGERGTGTSLAAKLIHRHGERSNGPFLEADGEHLRSDNAFFENQLSPWVQATGGTLAVDAAELAERRAGQHLMERIQNFAGDLDAPRVVLLLNEVGGPNSPDPIAAVPWLSFGAPLAPVRLPPLRERIEDMPLLATHFLQAQRVGGHTPARSIGAKAMQRLEAYAWPGNVRELRNAIEYAAIQTAATNSTEVGVEHLGAELSGAEREAREHRGAPATWGYRLHLAHAELSLAERAIRDRGVRRKAELVRALGYSDRYTLSRRIQKSLVEFPALAGEFPAVAALFSGKVKV